MDSNPKDKEDYNFVHVDREARIANEVHSQSLPALVG
jgi:hypothetical protein